MPTVSIPAVLQVAAPRDQLAIAADVAVIVVAGAVVLLALATAFLLLRIHKMLGETRTSVRQNLGPVSDRARSISDNVEFITQVIRSDVEGLNASVKALTDRLTLASDRMEERIEEFNALMEVVQGEAEDIFLDTAATVRGVREGARSITAPRRENAPDRDEARGPPPASEAVDEPASAATEEGDALPDQDG